MNSTFANIPRHQRMESRTTGLLEMHADGRGGARRGERAMPSRCSTRRGSIQLRAQVGEMVPQGVVAARLNWNKLVAPNGNGANGHPAANNVNALTSETLTDIGGGATFYSTLVEVRKSASLTPNVASYQVILGMIYP